MLTVTKLKESGDLAYTVYNQWQQQSVTPDNLYNQSLQLKVSSHFVFNDGIWDIPDYEGFAIISRLSSNPGNKQCFSQLNHVREILRFRLGNEAYYYWLPEDSYHQTIANTLSSERYHLNIKSPGLEKTYPEMIQKAFSKISIPESPEPISLKMLGFNVFGSCIALLGIFENENDYRRIMTFREKLYSDPALNKIDIKRTRPFIGHVTFAYLGRELTDPSRKLLAETLANINSLIKSMNIVFNISLAELCYFKNLSNFHKDPDYPTFSFISQ
jgi:hypothetical protein